MDIPLLINQEGISTQTEPAMGGRCHKQDSPLEVPVSSVFRRTLCCRLLIIFWEGVRVVN